MWLLFLKVVEFHTFFFISSVFSYSVSTFVPSFFTINCEMFV